MRKFFHYLAIIFCFLAPQLYAKTVQFTLNNGLTVIIKPEHRSPIAIVMVWYKVGSADEIGGLTGLSHVLEHMMFKGTQEVPHDQFTKIIANNGGQMNAFTTQDYTAYYEKIAASSIDIPLRLEADRMQNLQLAEQDFVKEINVIKEERRLRVENNPEAIALERLNATAYLSFAYQHPVIGWMSDINQINLSDLKRWYQSYYTPSNAILVIVGDVEIASLKNKIEHYFAKIPDRPQPQRLVQQEPQGLGVKKVNITANAEQPLLMLAFKVPSLRYIALFNRTPELQINPNTPYVLEVIAGILDAGENARLNQSLIEKQHIAVAADAYYDFYTRLQTQFVFLAIPSATSNFSVLKTAILQEIKRLKTEFVTDEELKRIKTQLIAQKTFADDSLFSQASELGVVSSVGLDSNVIDAYSAKILAVTKEEIKACANQYFTEKDLTEARLYPAKMKRK